MCVAFTDGKVTRPTVIATLSPPTSTGTKLAAADVAFRKSLAACLKSDGILNLQQMFSATTVVANGKTFVTAARELESEWSRVCQRIKAIRL